MGVGAAGLLAFALWQVCAAAIGFHWVSGGERLRKRVGAVAKAIAMVALAAVVLRYLMGRGGAAGNSSAVSVSADLLALPAGRALLGLAAVVMLVLAAAMTYTGVRRTFMGDLDVRRLAPSAYAPVSRFPNAAKNGSTSDRRSLRRARRSLNVSRSMSSPDGLCRWRTSRGAGRPRQPAAAGELGGFHGRDRRLERFGRLAADVGRHACALPVGLGDGVADAALGQHRAYMRG